MMLHRPTSYLERLPAKTGEKVGQQKSLIITIAASPDLLEDSTG